MGQFTCGIDLDSMFSQQQPEYDLQANGQPKLDADGKPIVLRYRKVQYLNLRFTNGADEQGAPNVIGTLQVQKDKAPPLARLFLEGEDAEGKVVISLDTK